MPTLPRSLRPAWRAAVAFGITVSVVAAICWYFGTDVWHAIVLGCVIVTVVVACLVGTAGDGVADTIWREGGRTNRKGSRGDVAELSWAMRGSYGRVAHPAFRRVQLLAKRRLAKRNLDLLDPDDRQPIEQLIGTRTYAVLVLSTYRRRARLRSLLGCLDVLDALVETPGTAPTSTVRRSRPTRLRARRPTLGHSRQEESLDTR